MSKVVRGQIPEVSLESKSFENFQKQKISPYSQMNNNQSIYILSLLNQPRRLDIPEKSTTKYDTAATTISVVCSTLYRLKAAPGDLCDTA